MHRDCILSHMKPFKTKNMFSSSLTRLNISSWIRMFTLLGLLKDSYSWHGSQLIYKCILFSDTKKFCWRPLSPWWLLKSVPQVATLAPEDTHGGLTEIRSQYWSDNHWENKDKYQHQFLNKKDELYTCEISAWPLKACVNGDNTISVFKSILNFKLFSGSPFVHSDSLLPWEWRRKIVCVYHLSG